MVCLTGRFAPQDLLCKSWSDFLVLRHLPAQAPLCLHGTVATGRFAPQDLLCKSWSDFLVLRHLPAQAPLCLHGTVATGRFAPQDLLCKSWSVPYVLCTYDIPATQVYVTLRVTHPHFVRTLGTLGSSNRIPELSYSIEAVSLAFTLPVYRAVIQAITTVTASSIAGYFTRLEML